MGDILGMIGESKFFFVGIMAVLISLLSIFLTTFASQKRSRVSMQEKFFKALDKKYDVGLVKDKSDIKILADSIGREEEYDYSLAPLLEDYLKYLTISSAENSDKNTLKTRYDVIKQIVDEETKEKPFADIPEEERRLLRSLKDAIGNNDTQSIQFNLDELSSLISARNKIYSRANRLNRWSIPLAIVGLITTVILGIMSITQTIDYNKLAHIINHEINKPSIDTKK